MTELSVFIRDEFVKNSVDKLFENYICIDTIEKADKMLSCISMGKYANIVFKNSIIKNYFIDTVSIIRPDAKIINCNCSVDKFFENDFNGLLIYNNLKHCKFSEIIEYISNHKGILLC